MKECTQHDHFSVWEWFTPNTPLLALMLSLLQFCDFDKHGVCNSVAIKACAPSLAQAAPISLLRAAMRHYAQQPGQHVTFLSSVGETVKASCTAILHYTNNTNYSQSITWQLEQEQKTESEECQVNCSETATRTTKELKCHRRR